MKSPLLACLLLAWFLSWLPRSTIAGELPSPVVPDGVGVNIHFTDPRPGEMEMLAQSGIRWVRMDLDWSETEREKGVYDFSAYDRLLAALEPHGIRAMLILDYANPHYDGGMSPRTDEGRAAFARWAVFAVRRFRDRGILWEMYNEPNIGFWKPEPNVKDYAKLAVTVGKALRAAEKDQLLGPDELFIGPALTDLPDSLPFLEECFKAGVLEYFKAVSIHPYRKTNPETAVAECYEPVRALIDRYAPPGKHIQIISGEWGYSTAAHPDPDFDEAKQGKYLARQWLTNLSHGVSLSIWYDWQNDGMNPDAWLENFGLIRYVEPIGQKLVYQPKPTFLASQTLTTILHGYRFQKRLPIGDPEDYVLAFVKDGSNEVRLVAWTTAATSREVVIPMPPGQVTVTGCTGEALPVRTATAGGVSIPLTDSPKYLVPKP